MEELNVTEKSSPQYKDLSDFGILDRNGMRLNPIVGEHLIAGIRLFEIVESSTTPIYFQGKRAKIECDYLLQEYYQAAGWNYVFTDINLNAIKLHSRQKLISVSYELLSELITSGKLHWWNPKCPL